MFRKRRQKSSGHRHSSGQQSFAKKISQDKESPATYFIAFILIFIALCAVFLSFVLSFASQSASAQISPAEKFGAEDARYYFSGTYAVNGINVTFAESCTVREDNDCFGWSEVYSNGRKDITIVTSRTFRSQYKTCVHEWMHTQMNWEDKEAEEDYIGEAVEYNSSFVPDNAFCSGLFARLLY